ncbi:MAG: ABC transporter substrate-binding protein [Clostridiales bacterium]|nr:ABC transporter substrate-binding protein [Clostridiales bacterium]
MKQRKRSIALLLCVLMMFVFVVGCGDKTKKPSGEAKYLNVPTTYDPSTMDVQKTTSDYDIPMNIFDRLLDCLTVDGKPKLVPALAKSWDISDDGLVYTFHLRDDVKFHNGEMFEADDVKFTIERMMNPENECVNTWFYDMIKGAEDRWNGKADEVVGVKVIDEHTVEITLEYAFGGFLANISSTPCAIYNREATEAAGDQFGVDPKLTIGSGPFIAKEWVLNDKIVLDTNPDYWQAPSTLAGIVYKNIPDEETQRMEFEAGNLDIFFASNAISQVKHFQESDTWKDQIHAVREAGSYFYLPNMSMEPYNDINVRKALASAIDKQQLIDTIYEGFGWVSHGVVVEGILGYNPDLRAMPYDPEAAKQYLAAAGYKPGELKIQFMMDMGTGTEYKMNIAIQAMLKDVGIEMELVQTDDATYYHHRLNGTIPMERNCWWVDYNDPDNVLYTYFSRRAQESNSVGLKDEWVFNMLDDARREVNEEKRLKMYQEIEAHLVENVCFIPVFQPQLTVITQPNITNYKPAWNGWTSTCYYGVGKN